MSDAIDSVGDSPKRQMLWGSIWAIALRWSVRFTGLISTVILARLLTPADYGIVSIATLIVGLVEIFSQTGQYAALIRHPDPTREHYDSAWTIGLLLGFGLGLIILALIPVTIAYFHEPQAGAVVAVLAVRTMMVGSANIGIVNFRRNMRFRTQFLFNVYPELITFVATLVAAFVLRNYWALVIGILAQHASRVVLSYVMEPFRPRICFSKAGEIWSFSIWTLLKSIGDYVNGQIDKLAIGGFAGAAGMGRYNVARDVAISPTQELISPMITVLMPVMANVQKDKQARRDIYLNVLYWSALICSSTGVGVALVAQDMADLVLGPRWSGVAVLMPWFALSSAILGLSSSVYSAFDTIGRPMMSARLQWLRVVAFIAAIVPTAYFFRSIEAVTIARTLITAAVTPTLFYALSLALEVPMRVFAMAIWRPLLASLLMAMVVLTMNAGMQMGGPLRLLLDVTAGAATYGASLLLLWHFAGRPDGPEMDVCQSVQNLTRRMLGLVGLYKCQ